MQEGDQEDSKDAQNAEQQMQPHKNIPHKNYKMAIALFIIGLSLVIGVSLVLLNRNADDVAQPSNSSEQSGFSEESGLDKAAAGGNEQPTVSSIDYTKLPLGDDQYSTSPKVGSVYSCNTSYNGGGAFEYGPWIDQDAGTWDLTKKISVGGSVAWPQARWEAAGSGDVRVIKSADLPLGHNSGTFPVASNDEAYQYDRNPNSIKEQTIDFKVPLNPAMMSAPKCVGGEVGIATTGVLLFNAFDAAGRDAVAVEIQDSCEGHPQAGGYYHYHGYSSCFEDSSAPTAHSGLFGYAFDGFGIYGLKGEGGVELTSSDLDECHGHVHTIVWDGAEKDMYHYHFTQDFPYTVSCFRGETLVTALSSGEGGGTAGGQGSQQGPQQQSPPLNGPGNPPPNN